MSGTSDDGASINVPPAAMATGGVDPIPAAFVEIQNRINTGRTARLALTDRVTALEARAAVPGPAGTSVAGVSVNASKHLIVSLSDGSTVDAGLIPTVAGTNGSNGTNGTAGVGITGVSVDASKHLIVTLSNGANVDAGLVPTVKGDPGTNGTNGTNGAAGVGISGVAVDASNKLTVTLTNGSTVTAGTITTLKGDQGIQGKDGALSIQRTTVTTDANGSATWTFPTAYAAGVLPICSCDVQDSSTDMIAAKITALTNTAVTVKASKPALVLSVLNFQAVASVKLHLTAIAP